MGLGRTGMGSRPLRDRSAHSGKKQQGSALQPAGAHLLLLLGRNGHDGSAGASPDPLLLAPDPFSWVRCIQDATHPGQLHVSIPYTYRY